MAQNKADLSALLANTAGSTRIAKKPPNIASSTAQGEGRGRLLGSHVPEEVKAQFRLLAAERDTSIENLHAEALNDLFAKYGKAEICPIKDGTRKKRTQ